MTDFCEYGDEPATKPTEYESDFIMQFVLWMKQKKNCEISVSYGSEIDSCLGYSAV
jgi:hypothetical protein